MYDKFAEWLDVSLDTEVPDEVVAFCFNLYEEENNTWSIELIGTPDFDEENSDWACEEVYNNREYAFRWQEEAEWEDIHNKIETYIRQYLTFGRYAEFLQGYQAVAMGFVDGELTIIHKLESNVDVRKKCPECGKELRSGIVRTQAAGSIFGSAVLSWCPKEQKDKLLKTKVIPLQISGLGYYCEECMKVFAVFEER